MENASLFAPWRMDYIRSLEKPKEDGCFICAAAAANDPEQARQRLVLWTTSHSLVLMNRYPYANGHLLVAPKAHKADPEELTADEHLDLAMQVVEATRLLRRAVSAQGFNLGVNLGRCAGAGVPGHLHHHVVPRWGGDVNFMAVVGEVRIIPQAISQLYAELLRVRGRCAGKMNAISAAAMRRRGEGNRVPSSTIDPRHTYRIRRVQCRLQSDGGNSADGSRDVKP